jgi:hypothetical protein
VAGAETEAEMPNKQKQGEGCTGLFNCNKFLTLLSLSPPVFHRNHTTGTTPIRTAKRERRRTNGRKSAL